jgi:glycosyltransferase involved in cell wall biosynthesis
MVVSACMRAVEDEAVTSRAHQRAVDGHVRLPGAACDTARRTATTLLSINNYYYPRGGAEVVFLEQNRMLEAAGWQVVPFAMRHPQNQATPWSRYFVEEVEFGHSYSAMGNLKRAARVVYSHEARRKLSDLLDSAAPDVAHLHNIYHHISPSILSLLASRGIPTVMTLHDLKLVCPAYKMLTHDGICERCKGGRLFNVVRHRCLKGSIAVSGLAYLESTLHGFLQSYSRHVDRFIVPSRFFREKFSSWGVDPEKMVHVPNCVDADRYAPAQRAGAYFLYFGRLAPEKGIGTLIRAAGAAGVELKLVGTGPEASNARALCERLNVAAEFLGYLTGDALHDAIRHARAVVLPSEWYENAPMSVLEAYALGVPVIGANVGGIPEMVREQQTGAIFRSGDAESLAAALRRFAELPDSRIIAMGRTARQLVETEYSCSIYQRRLLDLYRQLGVPC